MDWLCGAPSCFMQLAVLAMSVEDMPGGVPGYADSMLECSPLVG